MWVWVLSITVLGSNPEHVNVAKFENKQDCQKALTSKKSEYELKNKQIVGHCYYSKKDK